MGWQTINGQRYFYETTYEHDERVRRCWGNGIKAQAAAARVEREQRARDEDIALLRSIKARDRQIDHLIATLNARVRKTINIQLKEAGYHRLRGQWRKIQKTKMNAQTKLTELKNEVLSLNQVQPVTPEESESLSGEIRRLAIEALRGLSNPSNGPRVNLNCKVDETIAEVEAKVQALRNEFQYNNANAFDKLVIDQLTTAWVHWYVAGWLLDGELPSNRTWRQNQYFSSRYQQCQSRLTKAIDQLAKIRQIPGKKLHLETPETPEAREERIRLYREEMAESRARLEALFREEERSLAEEED